VICATSFIREKKKKGKPLFKRRLMKEGFVPSGRPTFGLGPLQKVGKKIGFGAFGSTQTKRLEADQAVFAPRTKVGGK